MVQLVGEEVAAERAVGRGTMFTASDHLGLVVELPLPPVSSTARKGGVSGTKGTSCIAAPQGKAVLHRAEGAEQDL